MNATSSARRLCLALGLASVLVPGLVSPGYCQVVPAAAADGTSVPKWSDIKNDTYDQRAHFAVGVRRLTERLDQQIALLNAKRTSMTTDLKDWDFAMKEVVESRSFLISRTTELGKATSPEAWTDAKEKVGEAWNRAFLALDKMNSTVTS